MLVPKSPTVPRILAAVTAGTWVVALLILPLIFGPASVVARLGMFASVSAGTVLFFVVLGLEITNEPLGVLLNSRNLLSLPRLQMSLWTIIVMSALVTVMACRGWSGVDPLQVTIPPELLEAMGISFVSAAAAPAILSLKSRVPSTNDEFESATIRMGQPITASGKLVGRPSAGLARLSDLVKSDDLSNAGLVDLSKVQQLLITAVLIAVYAWRLGTYLTGASIGAATTELPKFDQTFVNLLLVSHGGYLAYSATSKPAAEVAPAGQRPPAPGRNEGLAP